MSNISTMKKNAGIAENHCDTKIGSKQCTFSWTIDSYSLLAEREGQKLTSSVFSSVGDHFKWHLSIKISNGDNVQYHHTNKEVVISLHPNSIDDLRKYGPVSGNVELNVLRPGDNAMVRTTSGNSAVNLNFDTYRSNPGAYDPACYGGYHAKANNKKSFHLDFEKGKKSFQVLSTSAYEMKQRVSEDKLTMICELTYVKNNDIVTVSTSQDSSPFKISDSGLSKDFERFLIDDGFKDVAILIKGKNHLAHKAILAARSSVFNAMFRNNMQENKQNQIVIKDIDDVVFKEMLYYIYTGKVKNLNKYAFELLPAADKYDLKELKTMCEKVLFEKLSMENAARILILADMHNAEKLKSLALQFIKVNSADCEDFKNSEVWNTLTSTRPQLMKDMLSVFFEK